MISSLFRFGGVNNPKCSINKLVINKTGQRIVYIYCKRGMQCGDLLMGMSGATQSNTTQQNNHG
jgi:hypothetical protein